VCAKHLCAKKIIIIEKDYGMLKIGVLASGNGSNLQAIIDNIENGSLEGAEIIAVISDKAEAFALERAKKHNIFNLYINPKEFGTREDFDKEIIKVLKEKQVDLVVLAGYMKILTKEFVKAFRGKIINIHPSLIPAFCGEGYYGLRVHEEALKRGVKITGATVHFVTEEADAGPIIIQKAVEVREGDTPEVLQKRVMEEAEWVIYSEAIKKLLNSED